MNKATFIALLSDMLSTIETKKLSTSCPLRVGYNTNNRALIGAIPNKKYTFLKGQAFYLECFYCWKITETKESCPCHTLGCEEAVRRAKKNIEKYYKETK